VLTAYFKIIQASYVAKHQVCIHVYPNLIPAIQKNSFNPSSNNLLTLKIQHLRAVVQRPEVLLVTGGKKKLYK